MKRLIVWLLVAGLPALPAAAEELSWAGCGITRKAFMADLAQAYEQRTGVKITVQGGGATRGIRDSAAMRVDMGGSCRYAIEGEVSEAQAYFEPVAWDALVVIVHKDNPVNDISLRQLQQLFLGEITNWKQLGGPDMPVELYVRQGKISGVGRTLRKLVFANYDQEFVAAKPLPSSGPIEEAVEANPKAVAVTGVSSARKRDVKILSLEGKKPSYENIKSGAYMLYRPLYITYNENNPNRARIEEFLRFAHSREGREIIRNNGAVPYQEALHLVMKQIEQEKIAREMGLYH